MNNPFSMVVAIVAMAVFASIMKVWLENRHRRAEDPAEAQENARLREEVKALKERLQVLERITVEKENTLERQIEELRDR